MAAFGLPKESSDEKATRTAAIQSANKYAAEIPLRVMETASRAYPLLAEMAEQGNPASISDIGVGLLAVRGCIDGGALNVRINLAGLKDEKVKSAFQEKVRKIRAESESEFQKIDKVIESKLTQS
jgi:formiminotetrahydrofolate cyclodeaminase